MDTVIKGFLGVFIFAMIVYLSAGLISAEMDTHAEGVIWIVQKRKLQSLICPQP